MSLRRKYPTAPIAAAGVVVLRDRKVLLVKRAKEPDGGRWTIPGGAVELGETVREAAAREVREECGIEVEVGPVVGVVDAIFSDEEGRIRFHYILIDLLAKYKGGELAPASDALAIRWVPLEELNCLNVPERAKRIIRKAFKMTRGGSPMLEEVVGQLLVKRGLTVAVAESCTGGLIAHRLTNVPGSSRYFLGGVVAYANEVKERVLGVSHETLGQHGAVSEETALEMAGGARLLLGADIALAVTGIAGPSGGTPEKPVGLTYVALVAKDCERCERHVWRGNRGENKEQTADAALEMLRGYLEATS